MTAAHKVPELTFLAINASPSISSKTAALAQRAVEFGGGSLLHVSEIDAEALLFRRSHESLDNALDLLANADVLFIATPIYRATYSGLLKVLFDQIPIDGLENTACVLGATGGSPAHYLALDTGLRVLVASLKGLTVPTIVYGASNDFDAGGQPSATLTSTVAVALDEARRVLLGPPLENKQAEVLST